ncbi:MBL fold metallo-hydrolase [Anaerocolumna sp.]|uniref:MBL fold metallo-hydrolase n=1 Tax=Anaerocolumna sp. TaxID=2041569 RepID=UPI0028A8D4B6|nr:MBL fold metallo-hydrolase [Anaerocolumna sp.]
MDLCSISSGSSGNCTFVGSKNTKLLVDAGISGKKIENGLNSIDVHPEDIQGILVTHEHADHIMGLGVLARRYNTPIYGTAETINAILRMKNIGRIAEDLLHYVVPDKSFQINDITVEPFSTSHDASNPVCYTFQSDGHKVGMATDLGKYDDYIISKLSDSEILLLEANHDINMLMVGGYPYYLKQRILGDRGHLSNDYSAKLLCKLLHDKLKHITLAHLSKENNYEELAYETVRVELNQHMDDKTSGKILSVAKRDAASEMLSTT